MNSTTTTIEPPPPRPVNPTPPPHHHAALPPHTPPAKPNTKFLSILLQALIMAFVMFLFFVFVGVAAIIFLHICLVGGALHRRHFRRQSHPRRRESVESEAEARSGFSKSELKSLPRLRFAAGKSKEVIVCAVCLDDMREGDWCRELPGCKHGFHLNCVDKWLTKVAVCPLCRTAVKLCDDSSSSGVVDKAEQKYYYWGNYGNFTGG